MGLGCKTILMVSGGRVRGVNYLASSAGKARADVSAICS
jgi:hypothetical protein